MEVKATTEYLIVGQISQLDLQEEDLTVTLENKAEFRFKGDVELTEDWEDTSFSHAFGNKNQGHYYISKADVNIEKIFDKDENEIRLDSILLDLMKTEISEYYKNLEVERD